MSIEETWRPVPGFEQSHEVSNWGRVRYHAIVNPYLGTTGYPRVAIAAKGRRIDPSVHGLVAAVFLGPRPSGNHIHHKDRDRQNPRLENLQYVSPKEHAALDMHRYPRGAAHGNATLTEEDVCAIRASRERWSVLAARYGVSIHTIRSIRERSGWKHLGKGVPNADARATLAEADVRAILASRDTLTALAPRFGVSISTIHRVRERKSWKDLL